MKQARTTAAQTASARRIIQQRWPVREGQSPASFDEVRRGMHSFLEQTGCPTVAFSHFGLLVRRMSTSLDALAREIPLGDARSTWVEAYGVHVARLLLEGEEFEFIEPTESSPFHACLRDLGEGLHHVGFVVEDIRDCLQRMEASGVALTDQTPRRGSHGLIAFLSPGLFGPIQIEVCQALGDA